MYNYLETEERTRSPKLLCECASNKKEIEKLTLTVTKQYSLIYTQLQDISNTMARLTVCAEEQNRLPQKTSTLVYDFPLTTNDSLIEFERFIDDPENYQKLVSF